MYFLQHSQINTSYFGGIASWWPWFTCFDDVTITQTIILYLVCAINTCDNIYYLLLYTFFIFFLIGICLAIFQLELFTAFLWLVECSVLFVFLLLLFYVNVKGFTNNSFYVLQFILLVFIYTYLNIMLLNLSIISNTVLSSFYTNIFSLNDNYYDGVFNFIVNDLIGLYVSYFMINFIELLIVGFILLLGSIVCIYLYKFTTSVKEQNYHTFLSIFNFFDDMSGFFFMRRQNLIKQGNVKASLKTIFHQ